MRETLMNNDRCERLRSRRPDRGWRASWTPEKVTKIRRIRAARGRPRAERGLLSACVPSASARRYDTPETKHYRRAGRHRSSSSKEKKKKTSRDGRGQGAPIILQNLSHQKGDWETKKNKELLLIYLRISQPYNINSTNIPQPHFKYATNNYH